MRNRKSYEAFTLIEMLIVMGIIIVLMGVGITAGRFAINRANDVAHQNAVDNIYQGLVAYYTDNREYPNNCAGTDGDCTPAGLLDTSTGPVSGYLDAGAFDGGTDATFQYWVDGVNNQEVMVCVTLGGTDDDNDRGVYCNGNSFGGLFAGGNVTEKSMAAADVPEALCSAGNLSDWDPAADPSWGTGTGMCNE